jgi:hypothetical protein
MPLARIQLTRSPRRKLVKYAGISAGAGEGEEEKACPGSCCGYNWGGKVEEGVQTEEWELWLLWLLRLLLSRYEEANARPDAPVPEGAGAGVVLLLAGAGQNPVRSFSMKSMAPPMLAQAYPLAKEPSAAVSATRRSEQVSAMPPAWRLCPTPSPVTDASRAARRPGAVQDADRGVCIWRGGVETSRRREDA